jgi:hypothetical protein
VKSILVSIVLSGCGVASATDITPSEWCAQYSQEYCQRAVECGLEPSMATCYNVTNYNTGYPANCGRFACNSDKTFLSSSAQECVSEESSATCADVAGNVLTNACMVCR